MWASWSILLTGGIGALLLVAALAIGASPLLAVLIFLLALAAIVVGRFALRAFADPARGRPSSARLEEREEQPGEPGIPPSGGVTVGDSPTPLR